MMRVVGTAGDIKQYFPELIYKFRNWSKADHQTTITDQQVYFSPPTSFTDPFDCRFPLAIDFSFRAFWFSLAKEHQVEIVRRRLRDQSLTHFLEEQYRELVGTEELQQQFLATYYALSNQYLGVLSVTNRSDNPALWKEYAADFSGFCVGINLEDCYDELHDNSIGIERVKYVSTDSVPLKYVSFHDHPLEEVLSLFVDLIRTKYVTYASEEEYRLVKYFIGSEWWDKEIARTDRYFTVPKRCFKSVTIGYQMPESFVREIVAACHQQQLTVAFYVASPGSDNNTLIRPLNP